MLSITLMLNAGSLYDLATCFYALESIQKFFNLHDIKATLIICKRSKIGTVSSLYRKYTGPLKIKIIAEEALLPDISVTCDNGYIVQQLLKIAASNIVETDFYLTFDCDVICCQKISYDMLIKNGKIANGTELYNYKETEMFKKHKSNKIFMSESARLLNLDPGNNYMYGVTPQICARQVMIDLQYEIGKIAGGNWARFLLRAHSHTRWSEYGLYYGFIGKKISRINTTIYLAKGHL
jgi:hypothetical protein